MIIAVYSEKGGVGKTSISYSISKDFKMKYITNDKSVSMYKMNNARFIKNNIPLEENTLYDFGGFESKEAVDICNKADIVLVPTICDMNSLIKSIKTIKKIKNTNIVVIGTMIENFKEYSQIKQVINKYFPSIEVIPFRRNKLLKNSIEAGIGASDFFNSSNREKKMYKNSFSDYEKIKKRCFL